MFLLILLILAVIAAVMFTKMSLYVIGGAIGLLFCLIVFIIKRRRQR